MALWMTKNNLILLLVGTSFILMGVAVTGNSNLLGALPGYVLGFLLTFWLHRDTLRSVDDELVIAIRRMRRSFFASFGNDNFGGRCSRSIPSDLAVSFGFGDSPGPCGLSFGKY